MEQRSDGPTEGPRLLRTLAELRTLGGSDVTFGGPVARTGGALEITGLHSTLTRSLQNLRVRARQGLGGQALALGRPVSVASYQRAQGITHHYDAQVRAERLETMTAVPVVVDRLPRMVLYLAHRAEVALGDVWYDALMPLVRRVERDIAVDDEVRRRLEHLREQAPIARADGVPAPLSRAELGDIADELDDLAGLVQDPALRARLERLRGRVRPGPDVVRPTATSAPDARPALTPRERDVLARVALGRSNRQAAEDLGLLESTVKSYLKSATRKLGADNRGHAVHLARAAGWVD